MGEKIDQDEPLRMGFGGVEQLGLLSITAT